MEVITMVQVQLLWKLLEILNENKVTSAGGHPFFANDGTIGSIAMVADS
jgi:hypothetical protein